MRLQENYIENFDELVSNTNGHGLSRSLLLMQRAAIGNYGPKPTAETKKLLDVSCVFFFNYRVCISLNF